MAKKPILVTIAKGRHKTQPFTARIEGGKTDTLLSQRYTTGWSAKRGALRKLGAKISPTGTGHWYVPYTDGSIRWVKFVYNEKSK